MLQIKRGVTNTIKNVILREGEMAYDIDNKQLHIGDNYTKGGLIVGGRDPATTERLGMVRPDNTTISIDIYGVISAIPPAPNTATATKLGIVRPDNQTIVINNGVLSAPGGGAGGTAYILPIAGSGAYGTLGGVKVGSGLYIDPNTGVLSSTISAYTLPTAGIGPGGTLGGVKVDNSTITISSSGVISSTYNYTLPIAGTVSSGALGGVKVDGTTVIIDPQTGVISATGAGIAGYTLPAASSSTLGGVMIPAVGTSGITNSGGTIGLASASTTQLGGVKVDNTTIALNSSTQLYAKTATSSTVGVVKPGTGMTVDGTGALNVTASTLGAFMPITVVSAINQAAASNNHYVITTGSAASIVLPVSPSAGDIIWVTVANNLTTNVIVCNGKSINGVAENLTIDNAYATVQLRYIDNTVMWRTL